MTHNEQYLINQDQYLKDRANDKALSNMCKIISLYCKRLTNKYVLDKKIFITPERREDITYEVIERILTRYKMNSNWKIDKCPSGSIYFDWLKVMMQETNNRAKQQRFEDSMDSYEDLLDV